jgi:hypothetical protein
MQVQLNPAIVPYIAHVHVALAGFIAATAVAVIGLAWFGVRAGAWWALITAVVSPVVGLAVGVPMHYLGRFEWDWVGHLGAVIFGNLDICGRSRDGIDRLHAQGTSGRLNVMPVLRGQMPTTDIDAHPSLNRTARAITACRTPSD